MSFPAIRNIIQVGAGGGLGASVLSALLASGQFNITVLVRPTSKSVFPPSVKVVKADFSSRTSLVDVFKGQDALLLTFEGGLDTYAIERVLVDAAVEANIKCVIPSSFGIDTTLELTVASPLYAQKIEVESHIRKLAEEGKINHITIFTGSFFEWGLKTKFSGINIPERTATIYQNSIPVVFTTYTSMSQAVVSALSNPDKFANKIIRVHDFFVSVTTILETVEDLLGTRFDVTYVDVEEVMNKLVNSLGPGIGDLQANYGLVQVACVSPRSMCLWGSPYGKDDSKAVGLERKDLREETRKVLKELGVLTA